jgi:hypothetical protein
MRRIVLISLLLLGGCDYAGNPGAGFGGFVSDTVSLHGNPNLPVGDAPNMLRVRGEPSDAPPLLPEAGNVWPGPLPPAKTLSDLQRESATPIDSGPMVGAMPRVASPRATPASLVPPPHGRVLDTPNGPATTTVGANGVETYTLPDGKQGLVMPNANGTLTLIGSDGATITVPAPAR